MADLKPVALHPEAKAELQESVSFYREKGGELLAQRFKRAVRSQFRAISGNPKLYRSINDIPDAQITRIQGFPFSIIYIDRPAYIWIVAVAHGKRRPSYWKDRDNE